MDRGAWWATVHGIVRVGHDLATKPPIPIKKTQNTFFLNVVRQNDSEIYITMHSAKNS